MIRAQGIDISPRSTHRYMHKMDHDFVIVGVSDGRAVLDGSAQLLEDAQDAEFVLAYHYARSDVPPGKQIETYLSAIEGHRVDGNNVDFEKRNNIGSEKFALNVKFMIDSFTAETNLRSLLYSRSGVIQEWMFHFGVDFIRRSEYFLWQAQWPFYGWNDALLNIRDPEYWQPRLPAGVTDWKLWQYSADYNGKGSVHGVDSTDVDLDVFNGTVEDMREWLYPETEEPAPEIPDKESYLKALDWVRRTVEGHRNIVEKKIL